jgi:hypothetical protein
MGVVIRVEVVSLISDALAGWLCRYGHFPGIPRRNPNSRRGSRGWSRLGTDLCEQLFTQARLGFDPATPLRQPRTDDMMLGRVSLASTEP